VAETEAVNRLIFLARQTNCPLYIVHTTTPQGVRIQAAARAEGQTVITESCPQYLVLDDSVFAGEHPEEYICSPPIRPAAAAEEMRALLADGTIQTLGSDHCGYTRAQKRGATNILDAPQGIPGVETEFPVLYSRLVATGAIPLERLVRLMSVNPARVYGLFPEKGSLQVGTDADVVIYDPAGNSTLSDQTLHGAEGCYTPYAGQKIRGRVALTMVRGRILYQDGEFQDQPPEGRFVKGRPFDPRVLADL
jgi:dihydropyrimidinase